MSRSRKKAIVKDSGFRKNEYWKVFRRVSKSVVNHHCSITFRDQNWEEPQLKLPGELISDYDYADWIWDAEFTWPDNPNRERWRRK